MDGADPERNERIVDERRGRPAVHNGTIVQTTWDAAVIGAGPAGSVCACSALAAAPRLRVALVDMEVFPRDKACGDAVRADAAGVLRDLGLGAVFDGRPLIKDLIPPPPRVLVEYGGVGGFGAGCYIVERRVFDDHLFQGAVRRGAGDYSGHRLVDAAFDEAAGQWRLTLARRAGGVTRIACRTLVGADGPGSMVRRLAGVRKREARHTCIALRAYARAEGLGRGTMRVDHLGSLRGGYGWTFPLAGGGVNIGVILGVGDYKQARRPLTAHLEEYVRHLSGRGVQIGGIERIRTHPLPLASQVVPLVPRPGLALVGDAAAMVNPFTGEGIQYGVWAGRELGRAIGRSANGAGSRETALEGYARAYAERYAEHMKRFGDLRDLHRSWTLSGRSRRRVSQQ